MLKDEFVRGSEWRKCDLHIHTPCSTATRYGDRNNKTVWDRFIADIEANYESGAIIGINDYNTFEGYKKICADYPDFIKKYGVFPILELRTDDYVGASAKHKINLHIILSNELPYSELNSILEAPLTSDGLKILNITDVSEHPICIEKLVNFFNEHERYYKDKYLLMLGRNEAEEIENCIRSAYMRKAHFMCSASPDISGAKMAQTNTKKYYSDYGIKYIHCSDSHSYSYVTDENTRKIGHCFTWIKGKPCFETLRQAFFSYDTRICISQDRPAQAIRTIDSLKMTFPMDSKIGNNPLCFAGQNVELSLNPALNCVIGGRGTGKSLLLQLLCKNNPGLLPDKNIVSLISNWDQCVEVDDVEFEYFGQGTIEKLYEDKKEFQTTINNRLKQFWQTEEYAPDSAPIQTVKLTELVQDKEIQLEKAVNAINNTLTLLRQKVENDKELASLEKEIKAKEKIIQTFQDKAYLDLQRDVAVVSKQVATIDEQHKKLLALSEALENVLFCFQKIYVLDADDTISYYGKHYNALLKELKDMLGRHNNLNDELWSRQEEQIRDTLKNKENAIKDYLTARNMSKSNVQDAMQAQKDLNDLRLKVEALKSKNAQDHGDVLSLQRNIVAANREYTKAVEQVLRITQNKIGSSGNNEVAYIGFSYKYDLDTAKANFFDFIKRQLKIDRQDFFESLLDTRIDSEKIDEKGKEIDCLSDIVYKICSRSNNQTATKILDFFNAHQLNKQIYDLEYMNCMYNGARYGNYSILYQNKPLENLSFGQRATAVVLTLMIFGNKPIIIDEPETHLDQRMIATDLVDVIKKLKNDRQIIFATHNANIVVNADAEQIFVLKTAEDNKTHIEQMSIEDVYEAEKRNTLLMLEGSEEAFKKRESKYSL